MPNALITGIAGQDGSYLAELLLSKKYEVYGSVRNSSAVALERIAPILAKIHIVKMDLANQKSLDEVVANIRPDELYNLAAQSFLQTSSKKPIFTGEITALGAARLLDSIRRLSPQTRFYQASSSEMYGRVLKDPQRETTPFYPRNPYAVAKVYGHFITGHFRETYGLFAASGICFNHESPRRGLQFVTRKVTHAAASIKLGITNRLLVGNLKARRDWGFAGDYAQAMWKMLQADKPEDFVIATGITHTVEELLETAFAEVDLDWKKYVDIDQGCLRPREVADRLRGDASKARKKLGWRPTIGFKELVQMMVRSDLALLSRSRIAHAR